MCHLPHGKGHAAGLLRNIAFAHAASTIRARRARGTPRGTVAPSAAHSRIGDWIVIRIVDANRDSGRPGVPIVGAAPIQVSDVHITATTRCRRRRRRRGGRGCRPRTT